MLARAVCANVCGAPPCCLLALIRPDGYWCDIETVVVFTWNEGTNYYKSTLQERPVCSNVEIKAQCVSAALFISLCMSGLTPSHLSLCFFLHVSVCLRISPGRIPGNDDTRASNRIDNILKWKKKAVCLRRCPQSLCILWVQTQEVMNREKQQISERKQGSSVSDTGSLHTSSRISSEKKPLDHWATILFFFLLSPCEDTSDDDDPGSGVARH